MKFKEAITMSKYIYQTTQWQNFWLKTKDQKHFCADFNSHNFEIKFYQYPWILNQKIWFLPAGPVYQKPLEPSKKDQILTDLAGFLRDLKDFAKKNKISVLKLYFDWEFSHFMDLKSQLGGLTLLKKLDSKFWVKGRKSFMYQQIMQLPVDELKIQSSEFNLNNDFLSNFFKSNQNFWLQRNKTIRNQTKRSLSNNWNLETLKSPENIQESYEILLQTSTRQGFNIPSKEYFMELSGQDFSHFWLLKNSQQKAVGCWIGLGLQDRLVNLYGGNTPESFVGFGPNYLHLAGLALAKHLNFEYYDFGGYNQTETTAKFKDGYKGEVVNFVGNLNLGVGLLGKVLSLFC